MFAAFTVRPTQSAAASVPSRTPSIFPATANDKSSAEATRLVECYLDQCARSHSKLKLSSPSVKRLVYVPCGSSGGRITLPKEFSGLVPGVIERTDLGTVLKI